jgi:hypothetical protein
LNNKLKIISITLIFIMFISCTTVSPILFESVSIEKEEQIALQTDVAVPEIEFFISAPLVKENENKQIELPDFPEPIEDIPQIIVVTPEIADPIKPNEIIVEKPVIANTITEQEIPLEIPEKIVIPHRKPEITTEKITIKPSKTFEAVNGEDILIKLEKEGWIYDGSNLPSLVKLKNRQFLNQQTLFLFSFIENGEYQLKFYLQDLSSGEEERLLYTVSVKNDSDIFDQPIVIDPEMSAFFDSPSDSQESNDLSKAIKEENIPDIISSFDQIFMQDVPGDSELALAAFNLLERQGGYNPFLINLALNNYNSYPYDNLSAEMLYRAAQAIEQPGPQQDIEKALSLFKLVRDNFPISLYCDKSEERIRYLERHFMKIY